MLKMKTNRKKERSANTSPEEGYLQNEKLFGKDVDSMEATQSLFLLTQSGENQETQTPKEPQKRRTIKQSTKKQGKKKSSGAKRQKLYQDGILLSESRISYLAKLAGGISSIESNHPRDFISDFLTSLVKCIAKSGAEILHHQKTQTLTPVIVLEAIKRTDSSFFQGSELSALVHKYRQEDETREAERRTNLKLASEKRAESKKKWYLVERLSVSAL